MRSRTALSFLTVSVLAAAGASAQLPGGKLNYIFPPSGQAGSSLEVTVTGRDLNAAESLSFSHPGIRGEPVMVDPVYLERPEWKPGQFKVTISPEVPPGIYRTWFVGSYGISNSRSFIVSDLPQGGEATGNNSAASAHELALNTVAIGRIDAGRPDSFKVSMQAGQQIVLDCQAQQIGFALDAVITVLDASGRQLARARGDRGRDPVLAFKAPADGAYIVEVSDFLSAGGADRVFRLVASDRPRLTAVFPPAGMPGSKAKYQLFGLNLPGGVPSLEKEIEIPQERQIGGVPPVLPRELAATGIPVTYQNSNPVTIALATAPVVVEDPAAAVQKVVVPCEVAARLAPAGDADAFEFSAKKGESFVVEAISHRAGHPTDYHVLVARVVTDDKGTRSEVKVAEADDDAANPGGRRVPTSSRDPILKFAAPEDGQYVVRVIDQFELDDPNASYRLAIRKPVPDFTLLAEAEDPMVNAKRLENWSPVLHRGGRLRLGVKVFRRDGFDGEIQLAVEGAPPGVEVRADKIGKGGNAGTVELAGGAEMPDWSGELKIVGRAAKPGGGELVRQAYGTALKREVADYDKERVVSQVWETVTLATRDTPAPMAISVGEEQFETSMGGAIEIPLNIARSGAFKGAVKFYPQSIPNLKKRPEVSLDLNKVGEGKLKIDVKPNKDNKYAPGTYHFVVRGDGVLQFHPDPNGVDAATQDQKFAEQRAAQAAEKLKVAEAEKAVIAKAGLTEAEKANQIVAADTAITEAKKLVSAAGLAKSRAAARLKAANDRNKPRDTRISGYSKPIRLKIAPAPVTFEGVATKVEVAKGAVTEVEVPVQRLYGFADAVELSLAGPNGIKGFALKPVTVPKEQGAGKLAVEVSGEAPDGEHAFILSGKVTFNGVACALQQPITIKVTPAAAEAQANISAPPNKS